MSTVSEESQVFIAERHRHVDNVAVLRTEAWRTLKRDTKVGSETGKRKMRTNLSVKITGCGLASPSKTVRQTSSQTGFG